MILKHSYLRAPADIGQTAPVVPGSVAQAAVPREPSAAELATEFTTPDFMNDSEAGEQKIVPAEVKSVEKKEAETIVKPVEAIKPIVPAALKVEAKVEVAKPAPTVEKSGAVPEIKPILPLAAQPKQRDYTGYSAEEVSVLKQMSNDAFNYTSKIIKEQKELSKLKDASYLQHPLAYTLSPEYGKLQEDSYYLNAEAQFWQQQVVAIQDGKEWFELKGWNKDGSPAVGAPQKPTTEAAENARKYSLHLFNKAQGVTEQVQQFSGRYKQQIDYDTQQIKNVLDVLGGLLILNCWTRK